MHKNYQAPGIFAAVHAVVAQPEHQSGKDVSVEDKVVALPQALSKERSSFPVAGTLTRAKAQQIGHQSAPVKATQAAKNLTHIHAHELTRTKLVCCIKKHCAARTLDQGAVLPYAHSPLCVGKGQHALGGGLRDAEVQAASSTARTTTTQTLFMNTHT